MAKRLNPAAAAFVLPSPSERLYNPSPPMDPERDLQKNRMRQSRPTFLNLHPLPPKPPPLAIPLSARSRRATSDGPFEVSPSNPRLSLDNNPGTLPAISSGRKPPRGVPNAVPRRTRRSGKWTWQQHREKFFRVSTDPTPSQALETFHTPMSKERMCEEMANDTITEDFHRDEVEAEKLSKRLLRDMRYQWVREKNHESENYKRFKWGSKKLKLRKSPFIPKHLQEFVKHGEEYSKDQAARNRFMIANCDPQTPKISMKCMGGKTFKTGEGVVLAMPTIWSSSHLTMAQVKSGWPSYAKLKEEGYERALQGYQRRFPIPCAIEFYANNPLPYPTYHNQLDGKYVFCNNAELSLHQEQQVALNFNQLDLVGEMRKENDNEVIFDGPEEFEADEEVGLLGWELLGMLRCLAASGVDSDEKLSNSCFEMTDDKESVKR